MMGVKFYNKILRKFFVAIILACASPAVANDFVHDDACSVSGAWHQTNSSGHMDFLICDGSAWKSAIQFNSSGNHIRLDDDPNIGSAGCMRYDGGSSRLQFSHDCSTYTDLGGAGGDLWQAGAGDDIYYNSGAVSIGTTSPSNNESLSVDNSDFWNNSGVSEFAARINAWSGGPSATNNNTIGLFSYSQNAGEGSGNAAIAMEAFGSASDNAISQEAYGLTSYTRTYAGDFGFGVYVATPSDSTGGTMYGLFLDLDNADVTRYGIYQNTANDNYFAGNIGIGKDNPGVALDVVGNIHYTGTIVDVSDIRIKYDIEPIDDSLRKLTSLSGFSFKMKGDETNAEEYGVSAQDVQKVFPELVREVDNDGTLGVSYSGLIAPMIEAIKEQQVQIETLENEIRLLKEKITEIQ